MALPTLLEAVRGASAHPAAIKVSEAGSARRRRETVRDVDIIATARDPEALIAHFTELPWVAEVAARGGTKATVVSGHGLRFDLRVVPPRALWDLLQHFTGSKNHNIVIGRRPNAGALDLRVRRPRQGYRRDDHPSRREELYEFLGYQFIPPELRESAGELEAARGGSLPSSSSSAISRAISIRTRPGPLTGTTPSRRWLSLPWNAATNTSPSPITRTTCGKVAWRSRTGKSTR